MPLIVYLDYTSPYSYPVARWLQHGEATDPSVTSECRHFFLQTLRHNGQHSLNHIIQRLP
jgi:hypothetical protein